MPSITPQTSAVTSHPAGPLAGDIRVPGDKSMSHRALMLGGLAVGVTEIHGLLEGDDVVATARAMSALGAGVARDDDGVWRIDGVGVGGLKEPAAVLDMGNAGTGARLLMGLVASHPITCQFTGDASLCARPMERVAMPLQQIGARVIARDGCRLPLTVVGSDNPLPIAYRLPVPSAQVKSAVLLAGLNTPGETTVIEPWPVRDHSERMLRHFGATLRIEPAADGDGQAINLAGQPELTGRLVTVPGDPSSAAFLAVAALVVPGSSLTLRGVGVNPLRTGLFTTLMDMGAALEFTEARVENGEPVADMVVRTGPLQGVAVPAARAPSMIDEYPVLAVAAAYAEGDTVMPGLAELRVKESDRLAAMVEGLRACGVDAEADDDNLTVRGRGGPPPGGGAIAAQLDHRIAMAFLVLGMAARKPVTVDDSAAMDTSFPGFKALCNGAGANIT